VRDDLSIPQQCVQSCHAAIEMARMYMNGTETHPHLVLCNTDEQTIEKLLYKAKQKEIKTYIFREPDIGNIITAFSTTPIKGDKRKVFSNLKLMREGA